MLKQSDNALPPREQERLERLAVFEAIRRYVRALDEREGEVRRAGRMINIILLLLFAALLAGLTAAFMLQHSKAR